ncbi:ABC transporter permease [Brevibacterium album]|uniref:ABC transporter permease n=1 Tax=Brevibacterium album TaxID=417948 RepID=UPI00040F3645|nr:ABC transporter permease [Brevibacterium album]
MKRALTHAFGGFRVIHWIALALIVTVVLASLLIEQVSSASPVAQTEARFLPVGSEGHLLGTDQYGRDILIRLIYGARIELFIAVSATLGALVLGTLLGVIGGYFGGFLGSLTMRAMDVLMTIPALMLALFVVTLYGPGSVTLTIGLTLIFMPSFARIAYGQTLSVREKEYVEADVLYGAKPARIIWRTILPNISAPIIVQFTLIIAASILLESGLSYLGLGVVAPTPSWGSMVAEATRFMASNPSVLMAPALAVVIMILAFSVLGDGLQRSLDPRSGVRNVRA